MDAFTGEIRAFACSYAPQDWALCNGQILPIQSNPALFSIIGNTYGGSYPNTFALPNLQGQTLVGTGQLPGGEDYIIGDGSGVENVTLIPTEMPAHNHTFNGATAGALAPSLANETNVPANNISLLSNIISKDSSGAGVNGQAYSHTTPANIPLASSAMSINGNSQPHQNMAPYQVINYCICVNGIYPTKP